MQIYIWFILVVETEGDVDDSTADYLFLLIECLRLLIENSSSNAELFHQHNGIGSIHDLIPFGSARPYALKIVQQLIVDGGHDDLGNLDF